MGIQFTPLMTALDKTIDFFLKEAHNYEAENKAAMDKLNRKLNAWLCNGLWNDLNINSNDIKLKINIYY